MKNLQTFMAIDEEKAYKLYSASIGGSKPRKLTRKELKMLPATVTGISSDLKKIEDVMKQITGHSMKYHTKMEVFPAIPVLGHKARVWFGAGNFWDITYFR
jgi:hypothetical protein